MAFPERVRCFVAVHLDEDVRRRLARARDAVVEGLEGVKPAPEDSLHLTLKFLGEIPRGEIAKAMAIVEAAAAGEAPFESEVGGLGAFPPAGRPRVVWVAMTDPTGAFERMHRRLDDELRSIGVRGENRRYTPHVTLARVRERAGAFGLRERLLNVAADDLGIQEVTEIALVMSELGGARARYTTLGTAPLAGDVGDDW